MKHNFLSYINNVTKDIILEQQEKPNAQAKQQNTGSDMRSKFEAASKIAATDSSEDLANAAFHDIDSAYNKNDSLFDSISSDNDDDQQDDEDTDKKKKKVKSESIEDLTIYTSNFKTYYDSIINEGSTTEAVYDGDYVLVVNDDNTFNIVNKKDTDTKFSIDDYKKAEKWIEANKNTWIESAKKFGGSAISIDSTVIQNALMETDTELDKKTIKVIILKIQNINHFKNFGATIKNIKKNQGHKSDDQINELKKKYIVALAIIIDKCYKDAPNKEQRKKNKEIKADRKITIDARDICLNPQLKNEKLKKKARQLYIYFVGEAGKVTGRLNMMANDTQINLDDALREGTGDADDEYIMYSDVDNYSSWQKVSKYSQFSNRFITYISTGYSNDTLQSKLNAINYMEETIKKKGQKKQYFGDDLQQKQTALTEFIKELKQLFSVQNNNIATVTGNFNNANNFSYKNSNVLKDIIQKGKR